MLAVAIGAALEYSDAARKQTELQNVADAAALGGVKALALSSSPSSSSRERDALNAATQIIDAKFPAARKTITPSAANSKVAVGLTLEKPLAFAGVLGLPSVTLAIGAEAAYQPTGCMVALGRTSSPGLSMVGSASIFAPKCGVQVNATGPDAITMQGAPKVTASNICASGGTGRVKSSSPTKSGCSPAPDPYADRSLRCGKNQSLQCEVFKTGAKAGGKPTPLTVSNPALCDYTNYEVPARTKETVTLSPGVYCGGLSVRSADVRLLPGFYQIQDGPLSLQGSASLSGENVSILLSGIDAVLDLQGNPTMTLSAMTNGPLAGVAISSVTAAQPRLTSKLQGSPQVTLTGSIWLPDQALNFQGSPKLTIEGAASKVVAHSYDLHGSPDLIIRADEKLQSGYSELLLTR